MLRFFRKRAPKAPRSVRFYTREGCHLCDDALIVLRKHAAAYRLEIDIIDIGGNEALEAEYGHEIPVVFIDDKKRFFGQVDPVLLLRILNRPPAESE